MFQVLPSPIWLKFSINQALNRDVFKSVSNGISDEIQERYTRMRDRCFELVKNSNTDFPAYHIVSKPNQNDPADGISIYEVGYCRLLRDEENQVDVDVFSTNLETLLRTTENGGTLQTVLDDPDIYILGAYNCKLSGKVKRERREERIKEIRQNIMYNEQFYMEAVPLDEKDLNGEWGFRIANQSIAFAMRPLEDGSWRIWARPALKGENGELDEFVRLPHKMPQGTAFSFLSEGQLDCKDFDSAFKTVQQLACKAAMSHRKGEPDLIRVQDKNSTVRRNFIDPAGKIIRGGIRKLNSILTRPYLKGVAIGTGVGTAITIAQTLTSEGTTAADLVRNVGVGAVGTGLLVKAAETVTEQIVDALQSDKEQERLNEKRDITKKDYSHLYIADTADNKGRFLKKADPTKIRELKALTHHQAQMAHDSLDRYPENWVYSDNQDLKRISSLNMVKRLFGNIIARPGLMSMMWVFYPNGGKGFRHVDMQDQSTDVTAVYTYDENNIASRHAPKDMISDLPHGRSKMIHYYSGAPNHAETQVERQEERPVNTTKLEQQEMDDPDVHEIFAHAVSRERDTLGITSMTDDFIETVDPFSPKNIADMMIIAERHRREELVAEA